MLVPATLPHKKIKNDQMPLQRCPICIKVTVDIKFLRSNGLKSSTLGSAPVSASGSASVSASGSVSVSAPVSASGSASGSAPVSAPVFASGSASESG